MDSSYRLKIDSFLMYSESLRVQNLYTENRRATAMASEFLYSSVRATSPPLRDPKVV
jgi:hypothetical protein